ncbi:transcriptional regulator, RpiR family [Coriobacterium glomerans PW2]|uniref:Transcriptional regulator, RpiR family n=1 Tax=Coriobacterium glomerans (strain ATCC 49209 / DSM 20642 / JCM 10262 / PW2) TaxID=700015 RepID=F2N984_CORGP|nr:MurR/RpiR family transcriptional regulator [Coriobacterium glomerans]AEB07760.1 transcriptional regulator, RpiR family [Coriobacterium glomerans PW2]
MEQLITYYDNLTEREQRAFGYVYLNQRSAAKMKKKELAKSALVSKDVISSLIRKLGFDKYSSFIEFLNNDDERMLPIRHRAMKVLEVAPPKPTAAQQSGILRKSGKAICKARFIYILAEGDSRPVGSYLEYLLLTLGIKCLLMRDFSLADALTRAISSDELLILISPSGETPGLVDAARIARRGHVKTISLSAIPGSRIARYSSLNLCCKLEQEETGELGGNSRMDMLYLVETLIDGVQRARKSRSNHSD